MLPEDIKFKNFFNKHNSSESSSFESTIENNSASYGGLPLPNTIHPIQMRSESAGGNVDYSTSAHYECHTQHNLDVADSLVRHNR